MVSIQHQAAALHTQGFRIMPLRGKGQTILNGFAAEHPDFTCGPEWFGEPNMLIGLLCGPCPALGEDWLICLDLDGPFENDPTIVDFLELLPPTLTSHDGRHLFFRVSPSADRDRLAQWRDALGTKAASGAALDLRWAGGYACERGDWAPGTSIEEARQLVATLPGAALEALLSANNGGRALDARAALVTDRHVDPDLVPDPATWEQMLSGWANMYPPPGAGGGRDICFALGGLLARGAWTDELCTMFVEQLLERTTPDPKHQLDGMTCALLSLEKGPGAPGVYGIPRLVQMLSPFTKDIAGAPPAEIRIKMFLEAFVTAMQPAPTCAPDLAVTLDRGAAAEAGEDPDEALRTWQAYLKRTPKGTVAGSSFNVRWTLEQHPAWQGVFGWNELAQRVTIRRAGPPDTGTDQVGTTWTPDDGGAFAVQGWFDFRVAEVSKGLIVDGIKCVARANPFHPVREYLLSLPTWDGIDRNLVTYLGAEPTDYAREVCALWMLAAVKRAFHPGEHVKGVIILEGPQNSGKSTVLRNLCADPAWFLNVRGDLKSKDFLSSLRGKWIAEIAEIDHLINSRDASELKDLISSPVDTFRKSYDVEDQDRPRQSVFAGTTNRKDYLRDDTGNVRFQPVACGSNADWIGVARDRDQIWSQIMVDYLAGKSHWLNQDLQAVAASEAESRLEHDDWEAAITEQLHILANSGTEQEGFTTQAALGALPGALPLAQITQAHSRRMAKVLRKLGFECLSTRLSDGRIVKRWRRRR